MKYIITEDQLDRIKDDILTLPFSSFDYNWFLLQKYINKKGNPPYILTGNVELNFNQDIISLGSLLEVTGNIRLQETTISDLGNLTKVGGSINLYKTPIKSLGNLTYVGDDLDLGGTPIKSLGNLTYVGGYLQLDESLIEDLGKLSYVGDKLDLTDTPMSEKYTRQEVLDMNLNFGSLNM